MLRAVEVGLDLDDRIRSSAFDYLDRLVAAGGGLVTRPDLQAFNHEGRRSPLISPQTGIWKPAGLEAALSILTTYVPPGAIPPYEDNYGRRLVPPVQVAGDRFAALGQQGASGRDEPG